MNTKNRSLLVCLRTIEVIMQAIVFCTILMLSYAFVSIRDTSIITCLLVSVFPVIVLFVARHLVHKGIILFFIHIFIAVFFLIFCNTIEETVAYAVIGFILILFSLNLCTKKQEEYVEKMPIALVTLFIAAVILGEIMKLDALTKVGIYGGEVYILLQVIYHNFSNLNDYIVTESELTTLPIKQMMRVNSLLMAILVALCGGVMYFFHNSYITKLAHSIVILVKDTIVSFFKFIFSFVKSEQEQTVIFEELQEDGLAQLQAINEDYTWHYIISVIEKVLGILLIIATVFFVILGFVTVLKRLVKKMNSSKSGEDVKEFVFFKEISELRLRRRSRKVDAEKASNAKIRKLYKSIVTKNATKNGGKINVTMVPSEISKAFVIGDPRIATDIYEKARYSDQQVTQEEIEILKGIGKNKPPMQ